MRNAILIFLILILSCLPVRSGKDNHIFPWKEYMVEIDPHYPFYQRPRAGWYVCKEMTRFDMELSHWTSDPEAYYLREGDVIHVYQILMNAGYYYYDLSFHLYTGQPYFIGYSFHIDSFDMRGRPVKRNWPVNCDEGYDMGWNLANGESFVYFGKRQPTPDEAWTILHYSGPNLFQQQERREEERGKERERKRMEEERKRRRDREEERRKRRERMIHQLTQRSARSGGIQTGARRSDPPPHPNPPQLDYRDPKKDDIYVGTRKNETEILMWLVAFVNQDSVSSCPDVPSGTIGTWCYHEDEQADPMDKEPLEWFCRRVKKGELIRFTP